MSRDGIIYGVIGHNPPVVMIYAIKVHNKSETKRLRFWVQPSSQVTL